MLGHYACASNTTGMSKNVEIVVTAANESPEAESMPVVSAAARTSQGTDAQRTDVVTDPCLSCKKNAIEYCSSTCRHRLFCKRCAMKCATGGKCKICGEMFPDLRRV